MTIQNRLKKQRLGAFLVLGVIALTAIIAVVLAHEYSDHWAGASPVPVNQPMELRGAWLGMRLAPTDSATAQKFGIPATVKGVVVAEVSHGADSRVSGVEIRPGDVIAQVDGQEIDSLEELHSLSSNLDVARPLSLQMLRHGQPFNLVLPPPAGVAAQANGVTPVGFQRPGVAYGPNGCPIGPQGTVRPNCPARGWGWR